MTVKIDFKKALLLLGFLLISALIAFLLYKMFATPIEPTTQNTTGQTGNSTGLPDAGQNTGEFTGQTEPGVLTPDQTTGQTTTPENILQETSQRDNKISSLTDQPTLAAVLSAENNGINYYNEKDNQFYHLTSDGQATLLSDDKFYSVQDVTWSPQQNQAVIEYPDSSKIIYNFDTQEQVSLPKHWSDFAWSPTGDQLAFKSLGLDPENRWLAVVNSDGTGSKTIEKIGENADKVIVSWSPNNQVIAMMAEGLDYDRKTVYFVGLYNENFKSIVVEGRGFVPNWSPQGDKLIYSVYSSNTGYRPTLWQVNAQGDNIGTNRLPLDLNTWADKCVFASDEELYCAVPRVLEEGSGLFPALANSSSDDLYYVNLTTGQKTELDNSGFYNMTNLMISSDQKTLYFIDKKTQKLRSLAL